MKSVIILLILTGVMMASPGKSEKSLAIEKKVKELVAKMTIEEKVGQMTQVTIQTVSKTQGTKSQSHVLDEAKLEEAILKYHVGSLLNVYDVAHTPEYWHEVITKIQDIATKKSRLKIPVMYGIDAIHGATYTVGATLFPQAINMGASFNKELAKRSGEITSIETRASGIPWNFYPVLDLGRQPVWPRLWETFGEDVYLTSVLGSEYIKGAQGDDLSKDNSAATCLKHYIGYSFPFNGKDRTPAFMSERTLREYFLPPFEAGVKAGALTVMVNSAEVDGIPTHSDYRLLTEILRNELKFKGLVVSDWEDIKRLYTRDRVAESPKEAVRMAVMAGVDMSMVPYDYSFYELLVELVKEKSVPMKRIDEAVSRILMVKYELGLFENAYPKKELIAKIATEEHTKVNLEAAHETITLVKNDKNILPLSKDKKVLVTGPTANLLSALNGGWTLTWQGDEEALYPKNKKTILKAIEDKLGKDNVVYVEGTTFNKDVNIKEAVSAAENVDAVILCIGEKAYCETPGNIDDLNLDHAQIELAAHLIKTGKPVITVLVEGRPRVIKSIAEKSKAVLVAFLPGMEGGVATADILFGDANPSGKLPVTYPKGPNDIVHYDYKPLEFFDANAYTPQWSFGHGLSYTTFEYSDLKLAKNVISKNEDLTVTVKVTNTGKREGKEAVLLFLTDLYGSVSRPNKQLQGFEKINLKPAETKEVSFTIKPEQLSFIGRENKRITEAGDFVITVGNLKSEFKLK
ncbi:MAG TPA: glycoside hydrolase family 3 N-terminal domain-containing protein [Ignavibacteriaceae bacterium]|nr:glycoside hydrolase family 3 N-terminal domain-containing protein [Ignavibacteriaceae bacterium]